MVEGLTEELGEQLVSACRTSIGDALRSITYFTPNGYEQIYLRSDLESGADISRFVGQEKLGFEAQDAYENTELGEFEFMIRVFEHGFLTRVIIGEQGVFVTTDSLTMNSFEELWSAVARVLEAE